MPAIRTVVSDLYHNRVRGVGGGFVQLGRRGEREWGDISDADHIIKKATPVKFSFGLSNFSLVIDCDAADYPQANGFALFFEDDKSTVATITRAHRIAAGGGYSGCLYSVYRTPTGDFKCIHTARPGGAHTNTYTAALAHYANVQNWNLIHAVPTTGVIGVGGCTTVFCLTRVSYTLNPVIVRTVRLGLDPNGFSVARTRWNTPA